MLKLILRRRCTLCLTVISNIQLTTQNIRRYGFSGIIVDNHVEYQNQQSSKNKRKEKEKKVHVQNVTSENIASVKAILNKYNINTDGLKNNSNIFTRPPWVIEQRIMLLQELGATAISLKDIQNFIKQMYLPIITYKANFSIKFDSNVSENIFSSIGNNSIFKRELFTQFDETRPMRMYYAHCFLEYLKSELEMDEDQINQISAKKHHRVIYNSFRLLHKTLKLLRHELQFTSDFIIKNYWLLGQHPESLEAVTKVVQKSLSETSQKVFLKFPRIFVCNIKDLQVLLSYLNQYHITPEMIGKSHQVLKLKPDEFKRRMKVLSEISFTLVYLRHPRVLLLVRYFHIVIVRARYLESRNLKYATINSLTTYHNYLELLTSQRKLTRAILKSFCDSLFGEDSKLLMQRLEAHPCWMFIPLVEMYETLVYLKEIYSTEVIYKHIYAILYNKTDLEVTREALLENPMYSNFTPDQFLALCVYKIEEKCYFSGEAVLTSEKFVEVANEDVVQDGKIKTSSTKY